MTISEIKDLAKYLSEEDVEKIKKEIKDKESTLKGGVLDEEEMIQVLNTLFAALVIEKALESEIEEVEEIRDQLEEELLECYEIYDTYMAKFRKEDKKKKKKNWLLAFLGLSEEITKKKRDIGATNKTIDNLKKELNSLKQQKSNERLAEVVSKRTENSVENFREGIFERRHGEGRGRHHHHHERYGRIDHKESMEWRPPKPRKKYGGATQKEKSKEKTTMTDESRYNVLLDNVKRKM